MADIVIRRCRLRVTRHGGWSWGGDRRSLVDRVTRLVPELIAARLADLLGDSDIEIEEPLRLRVALRGRPFASVERLRAAIDEAISPEVLPALARATAAPPPPARSRKQARAADEEAEPGPPAGPEARAPPSLRELLLRWRSQGELPRRIRGFSDSAAALWLTVLLDQCRTPAGAKPTTAELLAELRAIRRRLPADARRPEQATRSRLVAAVELAARHTRLPTPDVVLELLDRVLPPARGPADDSAAGAIAQAGSPPAARAREEGDAAVGWPDPVSVTPSTAKRAAARQEVALCSVLPFLALGMLARIGWLETASATFQSLALPDRGSLFAAALAGKLLPPPERGWHRAGSALDTIAVFSGLDTAPSPPSLEAWSRAAGSGLSPLDAFVAFEIAGGHAATLPLLVTRPAETADSPWLLFDSDGFYPVAWAHDENGLLAALQPFRASILLVASSAATPRLMRGLRSAGFAFATDAPPARGEDWTRLPGPSGCWASPGDTPLPRVAAAAMRLDELEAAAAATCRELLALRPAVAPGKAPALDETAALAAAMGLGLLAWSLWRELEPVDPLLALLRLGDLDGTARLMPDSIDVRPAVGRRYLDLKAKHLLADIAGAPWLGGRVVRFVGP